MLEQNKTLNQIGYELVQDKLTMLFDSVGAIGNSKYVEDLLNIKINDLRKKNDQYILDLHDLGKTIKEQTKSLDRLQMDLNEIVKLKDRQLQKSQLFDAQNKETINRLINKNNKLTSDLEKSESEVSNLTKLTKQQLQEIMKQKERMIKMKNRRGKIDLGIKICKNCTREYNEKDNFNWSCKTHKSEWSGEIDAVSKKEKGMYWCCGNERKESQGCISGKHECKEDEDDEEEPNAMKRIDKHQNKNIKCLCCKEVGHDMSECYRDPNIKTRVDYQEDWKRIMGLKDYRKLFVDTMITTTHFLKKCAKVRKIDETTPDGKPIAPEERTEILESQHQRVF